MSFVDPTLITSWMESSYALLVIFALSFSESAFFIIPPELLLIPMALANPSLALAYGLLTTFASTAGAWFGYWIGQKGGKPVLRKLFAEKKIKTVSKLFKQYDTKAIFISAFTPIPFKIFTVSAGVFELNFMRFMVTSFLGRGARYMLLSVLIMIFGDSISFFLEHQLDKAIAIGTVGLIVAVGFYKIGLPFLEKKTLKKSLKEKLGGLFKRSS